MQRINFTHTVAEAANALVMGIDSHAGSILDDGTSEQVVHLLDWVRDLRKRLAEIEASIESDLANRMTGREVFLGQFKVTARGGTKRRNWDHDRLVAHVAARAADMRQIDEATGEVEREGDAVARILAKTARTEWRTTELRKIGIDPDGFCEQETGRRTIQLDRVIPAGTEEVAS